MIKLKEPNKNETSYLLGSLGNMNGLNRKISTAGIFFAATLILIFYLLGMRYRLYLPIPVFFIAIALMIITVTYQCLAMKLTRTFAAVVLVEIVTASLAFHLIYQIPGYGLFGSDAYIDMASLKSILISGFVRGVPDYVQLTSYFPMIHILGAQLSLITDIDFFSVVKWFPSVIDIAIIPLLYLLFRQIFKQERVALLSVLLFGTLQHFLIFGSVFIRETIALVLVVCCVYLYLSAKSSKHPMAYRSLAIVCLAGTIFAHHLTAFMLIVFLAIHWLVTNASRLPRLRNDLSGERMAFSFLLLAAAGTLTYWLTTVVEPVQIMNIFVKNLFTPSTWGTHTYVEMTNLGVALPTIRYFILIYGSYICYAVFAILLLYRMLPRSGNRHLETYSFSIYLFLCGLTGLITFYLLPQTVAGDRFLAFGWLFAFGPLVLTVVEHRKKWVMKVGIAFIVFFMFLNLYTIHPTLWDPKAPGTGGAASPEDYALAKTMDFSGGSIIGSLVNLMPVYDVSNNLGMDAFALSGPVNLQDFRWVIVNKKGYGEGLYSKYTMATLSDMKNLELEGSLIYDKNYVSNNISVFKRQY